MASSYFKLKIIKRARESRTHTTEETEKSTKLSMKPISNINKKCRICLQEGKIPIYGDLSKPDISASVETFGDIRLNPDDEYPKNICESCYSLLQSAIKFRKTAKMTEMCLQETVNTINNNYEPEQNITDYSDDNETKSPEMSKVTYNCKVCKINFKSLEEYNTHKNSKHHKNIRIQCNICYGLLTPQLYKRHLERHQSASHLVCDVCGKMYRKDNLIRHLQLHTFELPYECTICPYRGRFMESLKIHLRTHSGDKPFSCDKCELRFLTRSNLNRHLLTHKKDRPHKCIECGRGFYTKHDLDIHFKSDHVGIKDFGCSLCGNKYGTRKALMRHELRVHKRDKMAKGRMPLYLQAEYRRSDENGEECQKTCNFSIV